MPLSPEILAKVEATRAKYGAKPAPKKKTCQNAPIWFWPTIRWGGMPIYLCRWYGVPMPIRWKRWYFDGSRFDSFKGCGCIVKLKVLWIGIKWVVKSVKAA